MLLEPEACYRALRTRDARFDGRFVTAVRSTGIYCRPVCPARTPRRENCLFLACAAAAEAAGYRPCRRCRPESAPGTPAWQGTSATVSRGLRLIAAGALDSGGVGDLARLLGVGERHLRRLFVEHLGASPLAIAQTRRTHFAAQLLRQTDWPVSRVAYAAGFASLRRFNEAMRKSFDCAPRELRRQRPTRPTIAAPDGSVLIRLAYRPPLDFAALCAYLAPRAVPGVEVVSPGRVRRALRIGDAAVVVDVSPQPGESALAVRVHGDAELPWLPLVTRVRAVFDLGADPAEIVAHLARDPDLAIRLGGEADLRLPGAWEPFELAVRVILGQQVTVSGANRLAGRLAERFGTRLPDGLADPSGSAPSRLFPTPQRLADAPIEDIGLPRARAGALRALARACAEGELDLSPAADPGVTRAALLALPGIGPWTSELVALRVLRDPDAFPAGDLGLRRALGCSAEALERRAESWRPWRGYAALTLWTRAPTGPTRRAATEGSGSARSISSSSTDPAGTPGRRSSAPESRACARRAPIR